MKKNDKLRKMGKKWHVFKKTMTGKISYYKSKHVFCHVFKATYILTLNAVGINYCTVPSKRTDQTVKHPLETVSCFLI